MPSSGNDNTSLACETRPLCLCLGIDATKPYEWQDEYECDCFQDDQRDIFRTCAGCGVHLVETDDDTGKVIAA